MRGARKYLSWRRATRGRARKQRGEAQQSVMDRSWPSLASGAVLEVGLAAGHEGAEAVEVAGANHRAQPLDSVEQRGERFGAVVVEGLDLEVQIGILLRDLGGHAELRVERRRGQGGEPG